MARLYSVADQNQTELRKSIISHILSLAANYTVRLFIPPLLHIEYLTFGGKKKADYVHVL